MKALNTKSKKGAGATVAATKIDKAEKLSGSALLSPSFKTPQGIVQYLGNVAPPRKLAKGRPTPEAHLWQFPAGGRVVTLELDPDTALCGKDVAGYPWNPPWPRCEACVAVARGEMN